MLNCFKSTDYLLKLSPEQVINKLKEITNSPDRLSNCNSEFKGKFKGNTFKLQFIGIGSPLVKESYKPVFLGKATQEKKGTCLSVKMQMNIAGYIMILIPLLIWLVSIFCGFLFDESVFAMLIPSSIFLIAFIISIYTVSVNRYNDMRAILRNIFKDDIITS